MADYDTSSVRRSNLDGSGLTTVISGLSGIEDIALDVEGGKLYVRRDAIGIERANLDGTGLESFAPLPEWDAFGHTMTFDGAAQRLIWAPTGYEIASAERSDLIESTLVGDNLAYVEDLVVDQIFSQNHTFSVLANDRDPDRPGAPELSAVLLSEPSHGSLALASDGTFEYVPHAGFIGIDQFTYRADDGSAASLPTTVTIRVLGPLAGDATLDGVVDRLDAAVLATRLGRTSGVDWRDGDFDGDDDVDLGDFAALQRNMTPATAAAPSSGLATARRLSDLVTADERRTLRAARGVNSQQASVRFRIWRPTRPLAMARLRPPTGPASRLASRRPDPGNLPPHGSASNMGLMLALRFSFPRVFKMRGSDSLAFRCALVGAISLFFTAAVPFATAAPDQRDPKNAVAGIDVYPGLEATLFASEPALTNPTNIDIDHRGRVWVCDVANYRGHAGERPEGDRILILEDTNGDGKSDKSTVYYQGKDMISPMGICVLGNKVIVSASPNIFVFTDENGDDKPDKKELMFTNVGAPQHDHSAHSFVFGPDGKLYWNFGNTGHQVHDKNGKIVVDKAGNEVRDNGRPYRQGMVFRCNLDGSEFEVLAHNFRNNYEVCVDSFGNIWQSDNDDDGNRGVRINYVMEGGNYGYTDELTGAGWQSPRTNIEKEIPARHWHQNDPGVVPNLLITGSGSPAASASTKAACCPNRSTTNSSTANRATTSSAATASPKTARVSKSPRRSNC